MEITNDLLAAYAAGKTSELERKAVRQYLLDNPAELETVMMMMDEDYDLQLEDSTPFCFDQELDTMLDDIDGEAPAPFAHSFSQSHILPITSKAAQNIVDNLCSVRCEGYALRALGIEISEGELKSAAEKQGLLNADGTALYNIGQLSAQYGLYVSRRYDCTVNDIQKSLKHGDVVIAVIDSTELALTPEVAEKLDRLCGENPNHALIIQAVDVEQNSITLFNPGDDKGTQHYPLDVFQEAWDDSANYLIISNRNHYKPHPINLSDISLSNDIVQMQDVFAENIHEVWAKARWDEGWRYGPKRDDAEKADPYLLPYDLLPQQEKERYRTMALESIKILKKLGWKVTKRTP